MVWIEAQRVGLMYPQLTQTTTDAHQLRNQIAVKLDHLKSPGRPQ